jgi:hypothetical protein
MTEDPLEVHQESIAVERSAAASEWIGSCMASTPFPPNAVSIKVVAMILYDDGCACQVNLTGDKQYA